MAELPGALALIQRRQEGFSGGDHAGSGFIDRCRRHWCIHRRQCCIREINRLNIAGWLAAPIPIQPATTSASNTPATAIFVLFTNIFGSTGIHGIDNSIFRAGQFGRQERPVKPSRKMAVKPLSSD
jgi:hypothetical protein